jgi:hypothetical protein
MTDTTIRPVEVQRNDKTYIFNPEKITNGQYEYIEKELMAAGIDDRMSELINLMYQPEYKLPPVTEAEGEKFMSTQYDPTDDSEEAVRARAYLMVSAKRAIAIMKAYADCHVLLLKSGARPKLVATMLVPQDKHFTEQTYREVLNDVVPSLSREEVEVILSNFLPSRIWSRSGSPNYFRTAKPDQLQETTA